MLDPDKLSSEIEKMLNETLPSAFEQALNETFIEKSERGDKIAKQFGDTITELLAKPLAERLAFAIDAYVKNIEISTMFMSTPCSPGSPLVFNLKHMGNRTITNGIGASGMGPTGQGAISVK